MRARNDAQAREQDALKAQAKEREQTELAERRLYDVRMNLVQRYWEDDNAEFLQQGLNEQLPANQGGIDRRAFEWFYWRRKIFSGHITLRGHTGSVMGVAFSPDGKRLASAGDDRTVRVWDAATGQQTLILKGHTGIVTSVAFGPDGKRLASANGDMTVKLWDAATGQETLSFKGHTDGVNRVAIIPRGHFGNRVAFSPDGHRLASPSIDGTMTVWDARPLDDNPPKPVPSRQ